MTGPKQNDGECSSNNENVNKDTQTDASQPQSIEDRTSNPEQMEFTGERFVPEIEDPVIRMEHLQRYLSIRGAIRGLKVLDIACGEGYGSNLMADTAGSVIGVDISQEAIEHAKRRYDRSNLEYLQGSATDLSMFQNGSFDAVVSFETIEHIDETSQNTFLKEIKMVLKKDGFLIMSTPDKKIYSDLHNYHNEFHIHEFYKDDFVSFLKTQFKNVTLFNQYFEVTGILERDSPIISDEDSIMRFGRTEGAEGKYLVAIASDADTYASELSSVFMNPVHEYGTLITHVIQLQGEVEERNVHIQNLDEQINSSSERIVRLQGEVEERNVHIHRLDEQIAQLQNKIDKIDRLLHPFRRFRRKNDKEA